MTQNKKYKKTNPQKPQKGIRINKYLADKGISTRRGADKLILSGEILINKKPAKLGDLVNPEDIVEIKSNSPKQNLVYYAYNKPAGINTIGKQKGGLPDNGREKEIKDVAKFPTEVFPIGRLDKDSEGLIIMTNDGRITQKLLDPKYEHEKEYVVKVNKPIDHNFMVRLRDGVTLFSSGKKEKTKKAKVRKIENNIFEIVITEGKNRQIRRMCAAFNYEVKKLTRIRVMNIKLGKLKPKQWRQLKGKELKDFLKEVL